MLDHPGQDEIQQQISLNSPDVARKIGDMASQHRLLIFNNHNVLQEWLWLCVLVYSKVLVRFLFSTARNVPELYNLIKLNFRWIKEFRREEGRC